MGKTGVPQPDPAAQSPPQPLPDRTQFVTPGAYDPFEIVDLLTAFYELYVKMRYVKRTSLKYPPHSPPINIEQVRLLGFEPQVIAILQLLPYVEGIGSEDNFFGWGGFADFRGGSDLSQMLCDPMYACPDKGKGFNEENGPYVRPWVLPLNQIGNHGCVLFFDTKTGHIAVMDSSGGSGDPGLWGKSTRIPYDDLVNKYSLEQYHSRPAKQFFRDITIRLHTLEWIPFYNIIHVGREHDKDYDDLELLFRNYGWPDNFDADAFDDGAKRYREFRKVQYQLAQPKNQLQSAKRTVDYWNQKSEEHVARMSGDIWDNDPDKSPEEVGTLEEEVKTNQETLEMVKKSLVEVEEQLATRGGPFEIQVAWKEFLGRQIEWLQKNIDYWISKEAEDHSEEIRNSEYKRDRLKECLKNVQRLPNTMKDAIEPGGGTCIGLDWY